MKKILLSLFSFSLALGAMAQDAPLKASLRASDNGYVDVGSKDQVSQKTGNAERLIVLGKDRVSYLKFDFNSLVDQGLIPAGKTIKDYDIVSAKLRLVGRDAGDDGASYLTQCARVSDISWTEDLLSWNNQPEQSTWGASLNSIAGFTGNARGPYLIEVKAGVDEAVAEGANQVAFVLYQDTKQEDGKNYVTYFSTAKFDTETWMPRIDFQLQLKSATGIENETADNNGLTVNPTVVNAGEKISIQCDDATSNFEVYNVAGAHMLTASNNEVSTAGFQSGVYILTSAGKSARFIVK